MAGSINGTMIGGIVIWILATIALVISLVSFLTKNLPQGWQENKGAIGGWLLGLTLFLGLLGAGIFYAGYKESQGLA